MKTIHRIGILFGVSAAALSSCGPSPQEARQYVASINGIVNEFKVIGRKLGVAIAPALNGERWDGPQIRSTLSGCQSDFRRVESNAEALQAPRGKGGRELHTAFLGLVKVEKQVIFLHFPKYVDLLLDSAQYRPEGAEQVRRLRELMKASEDEGIRAFNAALSTFARENGVSPGG